MTYEEAKAGLIALVNAKDAELARLREEKALLVEALHQYANPFNWDVGGQGVRRVWLEPGSQTPTAYNGFELARAALAKVGADHD